MPQADPDPPVPKSLVEREREVNATRLARSRELFGHDGAHIPEAGWIDWRTEALSLEEALRALTVTVRAEARELGRDLSLDVLRALAKADTALG